MHRVFTESKARSLRARSVTHSGALENLITRKLLFPGRGTQRNGKEKPFYRIAFFSPHSLHTLHQIFAVAVFLYSAFTPAVKIGFRKSGGPRREFKCGNPFYIRTSYTGSHYSNVSWIFAHFHAFPFDISAVKFATLLGTTCKRMYRNKTFSVREHASGKNDAMWCISTWIVNSCWMPDVRNVSQGVLFIHWDGVAEAFCKEIEGKRDVDTKGI